MKYKIFKNVFLIFILLFFILATFFTYKGIIYKNNDINVSSMSKFNIEQIIEEVKNTNYNLVYESDYISEFVSLAFEEDNKMKSYIIDTISGDFLNIEDIIKEDKYQLFLDKEEELLQLKYPDFVVNGIFNSEGYKVYVVKDNELIIYYYDYIYDYNLNDNIFLTINYNEIHDCLDFTHKLDSEYQNENGFNYIKEKKTVAITFDDGPSSSYNSKFLETLANNKAHATFFMVGTMMNNCQKCVLDTYNSGNEIGSHTYDHINIKKSSIEEVNNSLKLVDDLFYKITNDHIKYIRPPYGAYSKENLENVSSPFILWNLDTEDWSHHDVDYIVNYVMDNVSDGSIILMHELFETSLQALNILLPKLYSEGYQVVSVSELANLKGKNLDVGHAYRALLN